MLARPDDRARQAASLHCRADDIPADPSRANDSSEPFSNRPARAGTTRVHNPVRHRGRRRSCQRFACQHEPGALERVIEVYLASMVQP